MLSHILAMTLNELKSKVIMSYFYNYVICRELVYHYLTLLNAIAQFVLFESYDFNRD